MFLILLVSLIFSCTGVPVEKVPLAGEVITSTPDDSPSGDLGKNHVAAPDVDVEPVALEIPDYMADMYDQIPAQANMDRNSTEKDDDWDIDSLVSIMTEGDVQLTAFVIKKLGELRAKTWDTRKSIAARIKVKKDAKDGAYRRYVKADKDSSKATDIYKETVKTSRYETAKINRDLKSYDRIMDKLNSLADWPKCKSGWGQFGRSCYKLLGRNYAYLQEYNCLKIGGSLVRVDNKDDKKAITYYRRRDAYIQVGFFRSLKTGNWEYLDGQSVNPNSWYSWVNGNYNNRVYNYAAYHSNRLYALTWNNRWGALCEHRLQVNLRK